jgi:hypothetical protein
MKFKTMESKKIIELNLLNISLGEALNKLTSTNKS